MPLDVMMPFYGDIDLLKRAVESVRAQSDPRWRLVVIDDYYPDPEPGRWVRSIGDPRVEYTLNQSNLGVAGNFQRCIDLARSDHAVIMGCDDVMGPAYVARLHELIERYPHADYFQPGVEVIDERGRPVRTLADEVKRRFRPRGPYPRVLQGEPLAAGLLQGNWTYFPSLCWRTDTLRDHGFRSDYRIVLDLALQLNIIRAGGSLVLDDRVVFGYRRHASASSWTGSGALRFREEKELFRESRCWAQNEGWPRAARAARAHITSRLNALVQTPAALRSWHALRAVLAHAFL